MIIYIISVYLLVSLSVLRTAASQWNSNQERNVNRMARITELQQLLFPPQKLQARRVRRMKAHELNKREGNINELYPTYGQNDDYEDIIFTRSIDSDMIYVLVPYERRSRKSRSSLYKDSMVKLSLARTDIPWDIPSTLILDDGIRKIYLETITVPSVKRNFKELNPTFLQNDDNLEVDKNRDSRSINSDQSDVLLPLNRRSRKSRSASSQGNRVKHAFTITSLQLSTSSNDDVNDNFHLITVPNRENKSSSFVQYEIRKHIHSKPANHFNDLLEKPLSSSDSFIQKPKQVSSGAQQPYIKPPVPSSNRYEDSMESTVSSAGSFTLKLDQLSSEPLHSTGPPFLLSSTRCIRPAPVKQNSIRPSPLIQIYVRPAFVKQKSTPSKQMYTQSNKCSELPKLRCPTLAPNTPPPELFCSFAQTPYTYKKCPQPCPRHSTRRIVVASTSIEPESECSSVTFIPSRRTQCTRKIIKTTSAKIIRTDYTPIAECTPSEIITTPATQCSRETTKIIAPKSPTASPAPQTKAPQTKAPQTKAPQTNSPQTNSPQTNSPQTKAPLTTHKTTLHLPLATFFLPYSQYKISSFLTNNKLTDNRRPSPSSNKLHKNIWFDKKSPDEMHDSDSFVKHPMDSSVILSSEDTGQIFQAPRLKKNVKEMIEENYLKNSSDLFLKLSHLNYNIFEPDAKFNILRRSDLTKYVLHQREQEKITDPLNDQMSLELNSCK